MLRTTSLQQFVETIKCSVYVAYPKHALFPSRSRFMVKRLKIRAYVDSEFPGVPQWPKLFFAFFQHIIYMLAKYICGI